MKTLATLLIVVIFVSLCFCYVDGRDYLDFVLTDEDRKNVVNSYLFNNSLHDNVGTSLMRDVLQIIHKQQHPPKKLCKTKRLLVLNMPVKSLEGVGSIMSMIMAAMAAAIHSNRVVVWGLEIPLLFEYSRPEWDEQDGDDLLIKSTHLDCTDGDPRSGPFQCFFQSLSSCSLQDATREELVEFSNNAFNETARLLLAEARKSAALYHPPLGLFYQIWSQRSSNMKYKKEISQDKESNIWAASVAAYVYRLKPSVVEDFRMRNHVLLDSPRSFWGVHVRHGDIRSVENLHYRGYYEFEDFFESSRQLSHTQRNSPQILWISTDSIDAGEVVGLFKQFKQSCSASGLTWFNNSTPEVRTLSNAMRFRTEHGSHTIAADGGCFTSQAMMKDNLRICSLETEILEQYAMRKDIRTIPRAKRIMTMMLEAIEDIYILSLSSSLVGQGSSYFSTLAALLVWARTGALDIHHTVQFIDRHDVEAGLIPTAFLPFSHSLEPAKNIVTDGAERWREQTEWFLAGFSDRKYGVSSTEDRVDIDPWELKYRMKIVNDLPKLHDKIFYVEAISWLRSGDYKPTWTGQCPGPIKSHELPRDYVAATVNLGVTHSQASNPGQALQCWYDAKQVIDAHIDDMELRHFMMDCLDIVEGNIRSFQMPKYARAALAMTLTKGKKKPSRSSPAAKTSASTSTASSVHTSIESSGSKRSTQKIVSETKIEVEVPTDGQQQQQKQKQQNSISSPPTSTRNSDSDTVATKVPSFVGRAPGERLKTAAELDEEIRIIDIDISALQHLRDQITAAS